MQKLAPLAAEGADTAYNIAKRGISIYLAHDLT